MVKRSILLCVVSIMWWTGACASLPETGSTGHIVYFEIGQSVRPAVANASVGDEIRWQNERSEPVKVGLLTNITRKDVACARGFTQFGLIDDFVTIPAGGYASLCLAHPGTIQFNVWFDASNPRGAVSPLATVKVSDHSG